MGKSHGGGIDMPSICEKCVLNPRPTKIKINKNTRFLFVTGIPQRNVNHSKLPYRDIVYEFIYETILNSEFNIKQFSFIPYVRCHYNEDKYDSKEKKIINTQCRNYLSRIIKKINPEVIIPLGADAAKAVKGRAVKITKARGVPEFNEEFNCYVLPMLDPGYCVAYPQHRILFENDITVLDRLLKSNFDVLGAGKEILGDYKQIEDLQFLIDKKPKLLAFDVETKGLRFAEPSNMLLTLQFCIEPGNGYLLSWSHKDNPKSIRRKKQLARQLQKLLSNTKLVGHNLKFDLNWVKYRIDINLKIAHDTLMMYAILDENSQNKDLSTLTSLFVPELAGYDNAFNQTWDKSRMDLVPLEDTEEGMGLISYGVADCDATFRLYHTLIKKLKKDKKLYNHYKKVSIPGMNAFSGIEVNGMLIDVDSLDNLKEVFSKSLKEQRTGLISQIRREIIRDNYKKGTNFTRKDFLLDILFNHQFGFKLTPKVFTKGTKNLDEHRRIPSTSSKDHLPFFFSECPFTIELARYIKEERLLNTNVIGFKNKYVIGDKVYPVYSLAKTVTGRTASSDPNCFPGEVEVLTKNGWERFDEVQKDKEVAQYDKDTGEISFAIPLEYIKHEFTGNITAIKVNNKIDILCTGNHRFYLKDQKINKYKTVSAIEYCPGYLQRIAGEYVGGDQDISVDQAIVLSYVAFDSVYTDQGELFIDTLGKLQRTILTKSLDALDIPHEIYGRPSKIYGYYIRPQDVPDFIKGKQKLGNWIFSLSKDSLKILYKEIWSKTKDINSCKRSELSNKEFIGWVQCLATMANKGITLNLKDRIYTVEDIQSPYQSTDEIVKRQKGFKGHVYCFSTPKGTLITRYNGRVCFTKNSQNYPNRGPVAKAYRKIFVAPKDKYVVFADLSQAEVRIVANLSKDPLMLSIYKSGGDIHAMTASRAIGKTIEEFTEGLHSDTPLLQVYKSWQGAKLFLQGYNKKERPKVKLKEYVALSRYRAKAVVFGYIYGMGHKKFRIYAKTDYGIDYTEDEARRSREIFFEMYAGIEEWHRATREFVHKYKYVRSYSGKVRHLPMIDSPEDYIVHEAERQSINCLRDTAEILTVDGWKTVYEIKEGDVAYSVCPKTGVMEEAVIEAINLTEYTGKVLQIKHRYIDTIATPNHRWLLDCKDNSNIINTIFKKSSELKYASSDEFWAASKGIQKDTTMYTDKEVKSMALKLRLTSKRLYNMSRDQLTLAYITMLKKDGIWSHGSSRYTSYFAGSKKRANIFLQLCAMIGAPAKAFESVHAYKAPKYWVIRLLESTRVQPQHGIKWIDTWAGKMWCPTLKHGTWIAKDNGTVFITGNSPVQEFASTLGVLSIARLTQETKKEIMQVSGFVHDAIYCYVPKEYLIYAAGRLKHYMESNNLKELFDIDFEIPIIADVGFGINGSETYEVDGISGNFLKDKQNVNLPELGENIPIQIEPEI